MENCVLCLWCFAWSLEEFHQVLFMEVVVDFLTQFLETLAARAVRKCTFHTEELVWFSIDVFPKCCNFQHQPIKPWKRNGKSLFCRNFLELEFSSFLNLTSLLGMRAYFWSVCIPYIHLYVFSIRSIQAYIIRRCWCSILGRTMAFEKASHPSIFGWLMKGIQIKQGYLSFHL